jgi:suppressor for copper-sensitivity B
MVLVGTAIWLIAVLASVAGPFAAGGVTTLLVAMLAFRAWIARRWRFEPPAWSAPVTAFLAVVAVASATVAPLTTPASSSVAQTWDRFDPEAIERAVASGRTVLVDVTAAWCLTCKLNELSTLDAASVEKALRAAGTVRMRADWSRPDPAIAAYLQRYGRYGIPLDVIYGPRQPQGEALPELLAPAVLLQALGRAQPIATATAAPAP